jgi:hypothetical protein
VVPVSVTARARSSFAAALRRQSVGNQRNLNGANHHKARFATRKTKSPRKLSTNPVPYPLVRQADLCRKLTKFVKISTASTSVSRWQGVYLTINLIAFQVSA